MTRPAEYEVIGVRRFHELRAGDMFRAAIADIRPGEITIKFNDGKTHAARSFVLPDARIGEESLFLVRENDFEGRIILEMVRIPEETKQDNLLHEILHHANLPHTPALFDLGRTLLAAGLPVDGATLQSPVLHRLMECPCALLHATPDEAREINRHLRRSAHHRTYHRVNKFTEMHVFKKGGETTAILTTHTPRLGRIEATVKQKPGHPATRTFRAFSPQGQKLLAAHATSINIGPPAAPFTLLSPPPADALENTDPTPRRFNFDIRV